MPKLYSSVNGRLKFGSMVVVVPEVSTGVPVCSPFWNFRSPLMSFHP
jgi:hypothetical protein